MMRKGRFALGPMFDIKLPAGQNTLPEPERQTVFEAAHRVLNKVGIEDFSLRFRPLNVMITTTGCNCPEGKTGEWRAVELADGTIRMECYCR